MSWFFILVVRQLSYIYLSWDKTVLSSWMFFFLYNFQNTVFFRNYVLYWVKMYSWTQKCFFWCNFWLQIKFLTFKIALDIFLVLLGLSTSLVINIENLWHDLQRRNLYWARSLFFIFLANSESQPKILPPWTKACDYFSTFLPFSKNKFSKFGIFDLGWVLGWKWREVETIIDRSFFNY